MIMPDIQSSLHDLGAMDQMARRDTPVHRLDPRAKIVAALALIVTAVSFGRYEISALLPLVFFPVVLAALGRIPTWFVLRKLLPALPFVLFVGLFNPFLDRETMVRIGNLQISGGWLSFGSILLRSALTLGTALVLIMVTGMPAICAGLERLGVPRIFVVQLLFLYRYLFVLGEEALRMVRARAQRSFGGRGTGWRATASLLGHLLLRTLDRAERIYTAMQARGFQGEVRLPRPMRLSMRDVAFVLGWSGFFFVARIWNLPRLLGGLAAGLAR
jgi:cobalt/nickel transport system permease protein